MPLCLCSLRLPWTAINCRQPWPISYLVFETQVLRPAPLDRARLSIALPSQRPGSATLRRYRAGGCSFAHCYPSVSQLTTIRIAISLNLSPGSEQGPAGIPQPVGWGLGSDRVREHGAASHVRGLGEANVCGIDTPRRMYVEGLRIPYMRNCK